MRKGIFFSWLRFYGLLGGSVRRHFHVCRMLTVVRADNLSYGAAILF